MENNGYTGKIYLCGYEEKKRLQCLTSSQKEGSFFSLGSFLNLNKGMQIWRVIMTYWPYNVVRAQKK